MEPLLLDLANEDAEVHLRPSACESTRLTPAQLYTACSLDLGSRTSADLEDLTEPAGQERALDALRFGIGMQHPGYNIFVIGPHGTGRATVVKSLLEAHAAKQAPPSDFCYVQNFEDASRPAVLMVPAGRGIALRNDLQQLVDELHSALPAVFESDDYRKRRQAIEDETKTRRESVINDFRARAEARGCAFVETPGGFVFAPKIGNELLDHEAFQKLPEEERKRLEKEMESLGRELMELLRQAPKWESEARSRIRTLDREVATDAIAHAVDAVRSRYRDLPRVVTFIDALERDVVGHANDFLREPEEMAELLSTIGGEERARPRVLRRYRVNVLVSHADGGGAPVIHEENPTQPNLIGQVEYFTQLGALVTDFNLIRPGALHRANGGYLVLDAHRLLMQPFAWEALKRALRTKLLYVESLAAMIGVATTTTLHPEAMPLEVKVVLIGERMLYLLLSILDPEFGDLFKVAAEFDDRMERSAGEEMAMARTIATIARKGNLLPFDNTAIAKTIEQSARWTGNAGRISTQLARLADVLREADYWARDAKREAVTAGDVERAVEKATGRLSMMSERITDEIREGTILVDTDGERVGVVNGISAYGFGDVWFGKPCRISATISPGEGEVVDIEREVKLGGPVHSKGVLILSGFIAGRFANDFPLSLRASLVFEQSYSEIEGDSASSAELYAMLSALSRIPLRQNFAVTGSVNQLGEIQAVGAVNEKIEGFFDVCNARGLTGRQGVVIPRANVRHLMLRKDVIDAVRAGRFHIHAVSTIDEGLEVLTGVTAGACEDGVYPPMTVNGVVQMRVAMLAQTRLAYRIAPQSNDTNR